jgi:hypothetical protein
MNTMSFDTLAAAKRIEAAGLPRATAEALVGEIVAAQTELFTKADGAALEARLEAKIEGSIGATRYQLVLAMRGIVGFADGILFFALHK